MNNRVYFDNAATTPMGDEAVNAMVDVFKNCFGNPSSLHNDGREAKYSLDSARKICADAINAERSEIFFTSGGSESDNWALKGIMTRPENRGKKLITTAIEHHAILHTAEQLKDMGIRTVLLAPDKNGLIDPSVLEKEIGEDTALVSVMFANNEIGTIEPVKELCEIAHRHGALFHTDAVQAAGSLKIDVRELDVDLLSCSAHKFYGPKGTGFLYVKKDTVLTPLIAGGSQERRQRAGTENVAGIAGMAAAIKCAVDKIEENTTRVKKLRDLFIERVMREIPETYINGTVEERLPGNINVRFNDINSESLLILLDAAGISASAGSACTAGSLEASHVLTAIGLSEREASSSVRFSIGIHNNEDEVDYVISTLKESVEKLRKRASGR